VFPRKKIVSGSSRHPTSNKIHENPLEQGLLRHYSDCGVREETEFVDDVTNEEPIGFLRRWRMMSSFRRRRIRSALPGSRVVVVSHIEATRSFGLFRAMVLLQMGKSWWASRSQSNENYGALQSSPSKRQKLWRYRKGSPAISFPRRSFVSAVSIVTPCTPIPRKDKICVIASKAVPRIHFLGDL
jgi:hypothetical protein